MAATAGTFFFKTKSGLGICKDVYVPDAVGDVIRFDGGAGAGSASPDFCTFGEDVVLVDASFAAAPTATRVRLVANGAPTNQVIRYGSHAYNLNNRPALNVYIRAGTRLGGVNL